MSELSEEVLSRVHDVAEKAVQLYAQGILAVVSVQEYIINELEAQESIERKPSNAILMRLAQRICSRELCSAWLSSDAELRDQAFSNLRHHLARTLQHTRYAVILQQYANAQEDVLHQTLETLYMMLVTNPHAGPDDSTTFLKWTQTILFRHARAFLQKCYREAYLSLESLPDIVREQIIDNSRLTPMEYVLFREFQQTLGKAIAAIRNPHYRQVLVSIYLMGMEERELARLLHVHVQVIYLWHHRALKALRIRLTKLD